MSYKYSVESLLRPNFEILAATACFVCALLAFIAPELWMMTKSVGYVCGFVFQIIGIHYLSNSLKVFNYQRNLKHLKPLVLRAKNLIVSDHVSFLGRGFQWLPRHTQRLTDTTKRRNEKYTQLSSAYKWARQKEVAWEKTFVLNKFSRLLRSQSMFNPVRPMPDIGGKPEIHGVGADEESNLFLDLHERNGHTLVLGTTRVGKSRLEEVIVAGDINRKNNVVIVIDPKGDAELFRRMYMESVRANRADDFYFFHLGFASQSCRYNPVGEFQKITEVAGKATAQLAEAGNSAAFKAFSWRFVNVIARATVQIGKRPTVSNIEHYVQDLEELLYEYALESFRAIDEDPEGLIKDYAEKVSDKDPMVARKGKRKETVAIMRIFNECKKSDVLGRHLCLACEYERSFYEKLVASLLPFLDKMNTGDVGELLSPDYFDENDNRPILNWREVIQRRGVVYIGLDGMADKEVATAVGNAMLNDIVSTAGLMYKHGQDAGLPNLTNSRKLKFPDILLHADEFNSLVGDEFVPLVNQSGGAGIKVTAYTQTLQDIDAVFGTSTANPKSMQIIGNFNTLIMMRVRNIETAKLLTDQLPIVHVDDVTAVSGASKKQGGSIGLFDDNNQSRIKEDKVPLIDPSYVMSLPKGQAFILKNGNKVFKFSVPMFDDKNEDVVIPQNVLDVCSKMQEKYQTAENWWEAA